MKTAIQRLGSGWGSSPREGFRKGRSSGSGLQPPFSSLAVTLSLAWGAGIYLAQEGSQEKPWRKRSSCVHAQNDVSLAHIFPRTRKKSTPNVEAGCLRFPVWVFSSAPLIAERCPKARLKELCLEWFLNWDCRGQWNILVERENQIFWCANTANKSTYYIWIEIAKTCKTSRNVLQIMVATETQLQTGKGINYLGYTQCLKG